ncbi:MAG: ribonuclease P protein component [Cumulibacter sp.]
MLSADQRIHRSADFAVAIRRGRKFSDGALVFHLAIADDNEVRCGFVVSKAVGGSVVRHRVTRRLRHVCSGLYSQLPDGTRLVVRALPSAANTPFAELCASSRAFLKSKAFERARR